MLERSNSRRRVFLGAQILTGVVAVASSFDFAFAQSPAAFGVYNRAATLGSGGFGAGGMQGSGVGAGYGVGSGNGVAAGDVMNAGALLQSLDSEPQVVDEPEYVYSKHEENAAIVSLEPIDSYTENTGKDAFLTASADKTSQIILLEGEINVDTGEWKIKNGRTFKTYKDEHRQGLTDAALSPDGRFVLTSSYDEKGRLWTIDGQDNIRAYLGAKDRLWAIESTPSGEYVAAACNDGRVYFWESTTVKKCFGDDEEGANIPNREDESAKGPGFEEAGHDGPVFDLAFSSDSQYCATAGADGTVRVWDVGTALQKWVYKNQTRDRLIDASPKEVVVLKGHQDKVYSVRFSDDGGYLLTASRDKTARIWSAATGEELCRFVGHTGAVRKAVFDGSNVLTASDDGTVRLWAPGSSANKNQNQNGAAGSAMGASPTMGPTASSEPNGAQEQNVAKPVREPGKTKGVELVTFVAKSPVFSVSSTIDGTYVLGGCADGTVKIWRVPGAIRTVNLFEQQNGAAGMNGQNTQNDSPRFNSIGGIGGRGASGVGGASGSGYPATNSKPGLSL